jgi:hypothetical protein
MGWSRRCPVVSDRTYITQSAAMAVVKGDVCPEPSTIGTKLRHLGRSAKAVLGAVSDGGQGGRQAFADRREVPT